MKKILIALVVLGIMLTGCAKEEVEKVDISEAPKEQLVDDVSALYQ